MFFRSKSFVDLPAPLADLKHESSNWLDTKVLGSNLSHRREKNIFQYGPPGMDLNQNAEFFTLVFYMKLEWSILKHYAKCNLIMSPSGRQEHEVVGSYLVLD